MILNKDKSKDFKRIKGNFDVKKSLLIMLLGGTLILSGCMVENVKDNTEIVNTINNAVTEEPVKEEYKIYTEGEHRVFVCQECRFTRIENGKEYLVSNTEIPLGYQLVSTDYETISSESTTYGCLVVINEYVNTVSVKVNTNVSESNVIFQETSFGTPLEKEEEEEFNKTLTKNLQ